MNFLFTILVNFFNLSQKLVGFQDPFPMGFKPANTKSQFNGNNSTTLSLQSINSSKSKPLGCLAPVNNNIPRHKQQNIVAVGSQSSIKAFAEAVNTGQNTFGHGS